MQELGSYNLCKNTTNRIERPWGIGGSDVGAIVGLSPYKSAVDVWIDKVGRKETPPADDAIHLRFGQHLEPFVAQEYERATGRLTHEVPNTLRHKDHPHLFAHVDRLVTNQGGIALDAEGQPCTDTLLECKTASAFTGDQWGQEWTDQVPPAYLAQCIWYMGITGCANAHLAVLLGNCDFRVYNVTRDVELERALFAAAIKFWDEHVLTQVPPEPVTRDDVVKLYPREASGCELEADEELLVQLRTLGRTQRLLKRLQARSSVISETLALRMRDAERICSQGKTLATWRASAPTQRLDVSKLRREQPDLVSRYRIESSPTRRLILSGIRNA